MADKGREQEAQAMREQGHDLHAAAHLMEGMIDEEGNVLPDGQENEAPEEIEDEPESEDDDSEDSDEVEAEVDDDGDEDSEEASDEAEDEEPAHLDLSDEALDSLVTVKVNGEDQDVTLREALAGTMRQKAFTLKTQELAEQRKAVEAEVAAKQQERQKYAQGLERLETALESLAPEEPDWATVKKERPDEYPDLYEAHQQHKARMADLKAERERVQQEAVEEAKLALVQRQNERDEFLTSMIPGWEDLDKARGEMADLVSYAQENYGYSLEDISRTVDPQAFILLRKAKLYDELSKQGEEVREKAKKRKTITLKPGSAGASKDNRKAKADKAARSRLSKEGSLAAAAQVFEDFIE